MYDWKWRQEQKGAFKENLINITLLELILTVFTVTLVFHALTLPIKYNWKG
jgi:hypothetical protein